MKIRIAVTTACVSALFLAQFGLAQAQSRTGQPIPGVDVVVNKEKTGMKPAPDKSRNQNRSAITTSRSNIKHNPGIADKGGIGGGSKPPGAAINTSRSNIKHNPQ